MHKRVIGLLCLLGTICFPALVGAQHVQQIVSTTSGRYSLTIPSDWVVAEHNLLGETWTFFTSETMTVATPDSTPPELAGLESLPRVQELDGAVISGTIWNKSIVEPNSGSAGVLADELETFITADYIREPFQTSTLAGYLFKVEHPQAHNWLAFLEDKVGNVLLLFGYSDLSHGADMAAVFNSLQYADFPESDAFNPKLINAPLEILPGLFAVDLPPGWWTMESNGRIATMPTVNNNFLAPVGSEASTQGLILGTIPISPEQITDEMRDENGNIDPLAVANLANLGASIQEGTLEDYTLESWQGAEGLEGITLEVTLPESDGLVLYALIANTEEDIIFLTTLATPDLWAQHRDLIDAIYATGRVIEEETD